MKTLNVIGSNQIFKNLQDKDYLIESISTNDIGCHLVKLSERFEIYFNSNCIVKFCDGKILIEGFAQIANDLGSISILIS